MTFKASSYIPTRVVFGPGRVEELGGIELPGKKALICVTEDGLMEKLGTQQRVIDLLAKNGVQSVVFAGVTPNPLRSGVMAAAGLARESGCDFTLGLGGGSSIDTAKAAAVMLRNPGDLWDYAMLGTGGKKEIGDAAPIVTVSTTSGTGTECDPFCVITNEETGEKLDFAAEAMFPAVSVVDPELMISLPRILTLYQGFDALFHAAECYITNNNENALVNLYAREAIGIVPRWLPVVMDDGGDLEGRTRMAYAADVMSGFCQALVGCTSLHIVGQTMGGLFQKLPHGASLILLAEEYFKTVLTFIPGLMEDMGGFMGEPPVPGRPGQSFVNGLVKLLDQTGMRRLAMSEFGIGKDDFDRIVDITVDLVGIDFEQYKLTKADIRGILERSYR